MSTWAELKKRGVEFLYAAKKDENGTAIPGNIVFVCRAPAHLRAAVQAEIELRSWKLLVAIVSKREHDEGFRLGDSSSSEQKRVHPIIAAMVPWVSYATEEAPRFGRCPTCGEATEPHRTAECGLCNAARRVLLKGLGKIS